MDLAFTSEDLIVAPWATTGNLVLGYPLSGIYANLFCQLDDAGVITPIGGSDYYTRSGVVTAVAAGPYRVTYEHPYTAGTLYTIVVRCYNALGDVDNTITTPDETGFNIYVAADCDIDFITRIINDNATIA